MGDESVKSKIVVELMERVPDELARRAAAANQRPVEALAELLRQSPTLAFAARELRITRQTLYALLRRYADELEVVRGN